MRLRKLETTVGGGNAGALTQNVVVATFLIPSARPCCPRHPQSCRNDAVRLAVDLAWHAVGLSPTSNQSNERDSKRAPDRNDPAIHLASPREGLTQEITVGYILIRSPTGVFFETRFFLAARYRVARDRSHLQLPGELVLEGHGWALARKLASIAPCRAVRGGVQLDGCCRFWPLSPLATMAEGPQCPIGARRASGSTGDRSPSPGIVYAAFPAIFSQAMTRRHLP